MPKNSRKQGNNPQKGKGKKNKNGLNSFVFRVRKISRKPGRGGILKKTSALGRLIRWPKYVKLQRQRKVLFQRLKIPPSLNVFYQPLRKTDAYNAFKLLKNYRPESDKEKRDRTRAWAKLQAENKPIPGVTPNQVQYGFNRVTNLVEEGRAKLVLIAHDVDPIELVLWLPTLCKKKDIPFAVVKGKARLGTLCRKKTASCVAICDIDAKDEEIFEELRDICKTKFNDRLDVIKKKWSGRTLGFKTRNQIAKRQKKRQEELTRRKQAQKNAGNAEQ